MKVLFLSRWLPYPADNGSKIRIYNLLTSIAERHEVSLVSFTDAGDAALADSVGALGRSCSSVRTVPYRDFRRSSPRSLAGLMSPRPRWLVDTFSQELCRTAVDEAASRGCDLVVASQLDMVPYALALGSRPAILEELELGQFEEACRQGPGVRRWRAALTWLKLSWYLRRSLPHFGACTVASELERIRLQRVAPGYGRVHVIPNAIDTQQYAGVFGQPEPNTLVYPGALTYTPNREAVAYFVRDILPHVAEAVPAVRLRVTGRHPGEGHVPAPTSPRVVYTGHVADVRPLVASSWACIVPLRHGGGTRLKILEAMALGTPVVSSSKGAEGLAVRDGENILLADEPVLFARRIIELLRSPDLRERLAAGGRALVRSKYDARDAGRELCALIERVGLGGAA